MNEQMWLILWWVYTQMGCSPQEAGLRATRDEKRHRDYQNRLARVRRREETRRRRIEYVSARTPVRIWKPSDPA